MVTTIYRDKYHPTLNLKTFDKIKSLGKGSFGETFLYKKGKEMIAVKELKTSVNSRKVIDNEIAVLKRLGRACKNFNVLCFQQVEEYPMSTFIITEYIKGKELFYFYKEDMKQLSIQQYCSLTGSLFVQLSNAIRFMHYKNVVHYDIKPENIMIEMATGNLKLIDFGLAKIGYPKIELSGYTEEYTPLYYVSDIRQVWHFNNAKTVDAYCLVTTFYKPFSGVRPLGVIQRIIDHLKITFTNSQMEPLNHLDNLIYDIEAVYMDYYEQAMPQSAYEYLLNTKKGNFSFPRSIQLGHSVDTMLKMIEAD